MSHRNDPHDDALANGVQVPGIERFPGYPATWYLFGRASTLDRPRSKRIIGRQLVAFRTQGGSFAVLDARCSHMGADLGCGRVVGESIQCPFHNWTYDVDGACTHVPGMGTIPAFARQACYPAVERHGYLFFFNGPEALFPLPFFIGESPEDYEAGRIFSYESDCTWFVNAAHGYDTQHFGAVHDRRLVAAPEIDHPTRFSMRNRYRAEVLGRTPLDRLLRAFAGRMVSISITNWGGAFVAITGDFDHARSRFIIATRPIDGGRTLCEGIVFAPRARRAAARILQPVALAVRRFLTHGYLSDESKKLLGTRYDPGTFVGSDRDMIDFFNWLVDLPQGEHARPGSDAGNPLTPAAHPAALHLAAS